MLKQLVAQPQLTLLPLMKALHYDQQQSRPVSQNPNALDSVVVDVVGCSYSQHHIALQGPDVDSLPSSQTMQEAVDEKTTGGMPMWDWSA